MPSHKTGCLFGNDNVFLRHSRQTRLTNTNKRNFLSTCSNFCQTPKSIKVRHSVMNLYKTVPVLACLSMSFFRQPFVNHLSTTCQPFVNLSSTSRCQPFVNLLSTTCQPLVNLSSTFRQPLVNLLSTFRNLSQLPSTNNPKQSVLSTRQGPGSVDGSRSRSGARPGAVCSNQNARAAFTSKVQRATRPQIHVL